MSVQDREIAAEVTAAENASATAAATSSASSSSSAPYPPAALVSVRAAAAQAFPNDPQAAANAEAKVARAKRACDAG